jgi:hypothetical protein
VPTQTAGDVDPDELQEKRCENKFQGIDIKQHQKQQNHVQEHSVVIFEAKAAREFVVGSPDQDQLGEARGEGQKTAQIRKEFRIAVWDF